MSAFLPIRLHTAVAAASARAADGATTDTASAFPKLMEWPMVPEDVQIPAGVSPARIFRATRSLSGDEGPA